MGRKLKQLQLKNIRITDRLFGEYVRRVGENIIPYQWKILTDQLEGAEPTYCIHNFRIAAGEEKGERRGVVFQDTDLYKWLESVAYCLAGGQGKEYEALADEAIELIGRAQEEDGYLNTYFTVNAPQEKWTNLVEGHELYTSGHMIEAAVAYYEATGKDRLLNIARKNADLIYRVFGKNDGQIPGYPGHQEIELALVKLYRATGEPRYLETARYFIEERGKKPNYLQKEIEKRGGGYQFFHEFADYDLEYSQAHIQPVKQSTGEGHAVRLMYMCAAMADLSEEYEDEELLNACRKIWDNVTGARMYITGGIGSSGFRERFTTDYDLPNSTNYSETCASIGLMMFGQRMASAAQDARYYDVVERALYNTVLAAVNIEGDRYFYVNPLEVVPEFCTPHTYMQHVMPVRQQWFSTACCPPNAARTLASLGQYIYAEDEEAVYIHQFISSKASTSVSGSDIRLEIESELLQSGCVTIKAETSGGGKLKIRIPEYAENWKCRKDNELIEQQMSAGYLTVELTRGTAIIELDFGVKPVWMAADDQVRADAGKTALVKGPLVYCLEEIDNGNLLSQIYVDENTEVMEGSPVEELVGGVPSMNYSGFRIRNKHADNSLYSPLHTEKEPVTLKAVPYCMWNNRGEGEMLVWQKVKFW